jgi:uncharacterized membrane protein YphA (DoxX/SURF4 family)
MKTNWPLQLVRLFLAAVFILAAVSKLTDFESFRLSIGAHEFVPVSLIRFVTAFVPGLELTLAFALLFSPQWPPLSWTILALMAAFLLYQIVYKWKGSEWGFPADGTCNCMKLPTTAGIDSIHPIVRNAIFTAISILYVWLERRDGHPPLAQAHPAVEAGTPSA